MKVRYQADADLNKAIVLAVARKEPSVDFRTAHEAGLEGVEELVLIWALTEPSEWVNRICALPL